MPRLQFGLAAFGPFLGLIRVLLNVIDCSAGTGKESKGETKGEGGKETKEKASLVKVCSFVLELIASLLSECGHVS